MMRHTKSCSCTSCAYRSYAKRPSVQQLIDEGTRIDRLFYGKYLPLRERKLLEKLIRTRAIYDDVRDQLLSTSGSSGHTRSEYTFKSQGDDSIAKSSTVSKLVNLVDRGKIGSSNAVLSSCCSCCSCSSIKKIKKHLKKHPPSYKKPDIPYENIAKYKLRAEKRPRSRRKSIGSKIREVRFKSRNIYSEACLCTKSLNDMVKRSSKALKTKLRSKEDATVSFESSASNTKVKSKAKKKTMLKIGKNRKSIASETPKRFPIKKDSLTLYRDKMRRKHARKKAKDKASQLCDPATCKHKSHGKEKKVGKDGVLIDPAVCIPEECGHIETCLKTGKTMTKKTTLEEWECEPGICVPDECDPEICYKRIMARRGGTTLEEWECEPGICVPDECDPKICYKRIMARRGGNVKKRKGRHKMSGSSKANSSIFAKVKRKNSATETKPKDLKPIKHSSSQSRSSHSMRRSQIEHTLKRCFCTLKLQKKKKNLNKTRSQKTMASLSVQSVEKIERVRKTQTKSAGITYVVPPMATPPRNLLPYECEPFVCIPGECDPYVCEKRIQARLRTEVSHEDGSLMTKKKMRMYTKGIKVHKPRVRYSRSQTIKTEKTKQTHTTPFLQRCFCTLKLFNKDKSKKNAVIVTPPRKVAKPYKTKLKDKYSSSSLSSKSRYNKKLGSGMSSEKTELESYAKEPKLTKHTDSHPKGTDQINIFPSPSNKQAVRIGSSISFNIEFYKEKLPLNYSKEVVETTKLKRKKTRDNTIAIHERKKSRKVALKAKGSQPSHTVVDYKTMTSEVKVKEKGIFVGSATPTCFCTLKLQKKGKHSKTGEHGYDTSKGTETTLELYGPKNTSEYKSTSTSKSFRYDLASFCVPATCDAYESYDKIKKREVKRFRNRNIATEEKKRQSTMSMTYNGLSGSFKARSTQSHIAGYVPHKDKVIHRKETSRQAVRIGSNFSFSVDFYKDRAASITRDIMKPKIHRITSDLTFKTQIRNKKINPNQYLVKDHLSRANSLIEKKDLPSNVGHKLKRCFCTLKLKKSGNVNKVKDRNHQWLRPITTQFMHVVQGKQYDKSMSEFTRVNQISTENQCQVIKCTSNKIEKRNVTTTSILDLQNSTNVFNRSNSKIKIRNHNLFKANSDGKDPYLTSNINFNIEYGKNRHSTAKFRQLDEYQVGYLFNTHQTHMKNNPFCRSYYALNLKVSQMRKQDGNSKLIETDSIETRVGMNSTRQRGHRATIATRFSKSQRIQSRRDRKKNKNDFNPAKRVTHIGSSINYNLNFYKDTSSRVNDSRPTTQVNKRRKSSDLHQNNHPQYDHIKKSKNFTLGMRNRRRSTKSERSIKRQINKRRITNPYRNASITKSRATTTDSLILKHKKFDRNEYDPQEYVKAKQQLLRKGQEQISAGDHVTAARRRNRFRSIRNDANSNHQTISGKNQKVVIDKVRKNQHNRLIELCDPQQCMKIMVSVLGKNRVQDPAGDHLSYQNRKSKFMAFRKDSYAFPYENTNKTQAVTNDKMKLEKYKQDLNNCHPEECRKILQQLLRKGRGQRSVTLNQQDQYGNGSTDINENQAVLFDQYKRHVKECDPEECRNILQQILKRSQGRVLTDDHVSTTSRKHWFSKCDCKRKLQSSAKCDCKRKLQSSAKCDCKTKLQSSAGDYVNDAHSRNRFKSIRTDRAARIARSKFTPDMPDELKKIMMQPAKSDVVKYGSNFSINIEFFKDSASDLYPIPSSRNNNYQGPRDSSGYSRKQQLYSGVRRPRKSNYDTDGSSHTVPYGSRSRTFRIGSKNPEEMFTVSQMLKKCVCSLKGRKTKDEARDAQGDGPSRGTMSKINRDICKCRSPHHTCKCKLKHHKYKLPNHKCKCKTVRCKCSKYAKHITEEPPIEPQVPSGSFIRKCFCKLGLMQDRKALQLKPSTQTIPTEYSQIHKPYPYLSDQSTDMDTIMPYSKRKFRKHGSQSKISKVGPCQCPENERARKTEQQTNEPCRCPERERARKTEQQTNEGHKKVGQKKNQIGITLPKGNLKKQLVNCICKFKNTNQKDAHQLQPLFEMIVDSHTMSVKNKDDIIRDLLSGHIATDVYNYDNLPEHGTTNKGPTFEKGQVAAPVVDFAINNNKVNKTHNMTHKHNIMHMHHNKIIEPPIIPAGPPFSRPPRPIFGKRPGKSKKINKQAMQNMPIHPRGCQCCDCRRGGKKRMKVIEKAKKEKKEDKYKLHIKPCFCGTSICKKETKRLKLLHDMHSPHIKKKKCVCGSQVCKYRAKNEKTNFKSILKKKKLEDLKRHKERIRRLKSYVKEDAKIRKLRKKADKKALKRVKRGEKSNDLSLFVDSIVDIAKFGRRHTCGILRSTVRVLSHPDDAWYRFKRGAEDIGNAVNNLTDIVFKHSGIHSLAKRLKIRIAAMRSTKIIVSEMETHPLSHAILQAVDKKHRKGPMKRPRTPVDFNCSAYMGSLRQRPCLWIYYLCPWFYPHCISCLGVWRQFTDILLFILAIGVWSPCILGMEAVRALMCCLVCTA